jgi:hypothetical protein
VDQPFAFVPNPFVVNQSIGGAGGGQGGGAGGGAAGGLPNIAPAAGGNLNDIAPAAGGPGGEQTAQACPALTDQWVNQELNTFAFGNLTQQLQQIEDCRLALERGVGQQP